MAFLARIEDCRTNRVWWEVRETEDEIMALCESVSSIHNHEEWTHLFVYAELNDYGPDWLKGRSSEPNGEGKEAP